MDLTELDIEHLAARLTENPQSPLFARLADLYLSRQRVGEAAAMCEKGIALYPSYAGGHIVLGKCYQQLGEFSKARAAYRQALTLSPYNTVVLRLLVALPETDAGAGAPVTAAPKAEVPSSAAATTRTTTASPIPAEKQSAVQPLAGVVPPVVPVVSPAAVVVPPVAAIMSPAAVVAPKGAPIVPPAAIVVPASASAVPPIGDTAEPIDLVTPIEQQWIPIYDPLPEPDALSAAAAPTFDPFPTFEQYIDMHPTTEPTMTLEEYLKGRVSSPMSEPSTDFESLARKLQNAKRIVPTEAPLPSSPAMAEPESVMQAIVSPTMAEIYASQNEFGAAISAYEALILRQPEQSALFSRRIDELKEAQKNRPQ